MFNHYNNLKTFNAALFKQQFIFLKKKSLCIHLVQLRMYTYR